MTCAPAGIDWPPISTTSSGVAEGRMRNGGVVAEQFLDCGRHPVRIAAQQLELLRVIEEGDDGVADERRGGVVTGHDELEDGREQLLVVQPLLPVPSRDQGAHEVIVGCVVLGLDQLAQLRHDGVGRLLGPRVVGRGRSGDEHGHETLTQRGAFAFGHAEQLADDGEREREGECRHQIGGCLGIPVGQNVEEVVHDGLHPRPQPLDSAHRERGRHEPTQTGVIRRVHSEHVAGELGTREALGHHTVAQARARPACPWRTGSR